jgi:hypothetical protein
MTYLARIRISYIGYIAIARYMQTVRLSGIYKQLNPGIFTNPLETKETVEIFSYKIVSNANITSRDSPS